ncbi:MAG: hypothetical protein Q8755_02720, partial [Candidatus Phytoplasma australasiaticum]|nr:hypothetical protein [Candidatus Phytoplasma australasiaticum]
MGFALIAKPIKGRDLRSFSTSFSCPLRVFRRKNTIVEFLKLFPEILSLSFFTLFRDYFPMATTSKKTKGGKGKKKEADVVPRWTEIPV